MLKITNLETTYHDVILALKGISLTVPAGAIVALLGSNGAGKTTTINTVCGIRKTLNLEVEDGTMEFAGSIINDRAPHEIVALGISQVPEGRRIFAELTVEENIRIGSWRIDRRRYPENRERVLRHFPVLRERGRQLAGYLSGGEQQMLAIARALMAEPRLLIMDEPSLGIAPIVRSLRSSTGSTWRRGPRFSLLSRMQTRPCPSPVTATSWRTGASSWKGRRRNSGRAGISASSTWA